MSNGRAQSGSAPALRIGPTTFQQVLSTPRITLAECAQDVAAGFLPDRHLYWYSRCKILWDPSYDLLAGHLADSDLPVLDLGCGAGVFAAFLRKRGFASAYRGVDLDARKIGQAATAVSSLWEHTFFEACDAADYVRNTGFRGNLVALDILHYFTTAGQVEFLKNLARLVPAGGRLFLRNGVRDAPGLRHAVTSLEEAIVRGSSWIRGGEWNFPSRDLIHHTLRDSGLAVVNVPLWGDTPFSSNLFVAARPSVQRAG